MTGKMRKLWFTRRHGDIRGPFPSAAIAEFLLIGRLQQTDEVSQDKETWQRIHRLPELIPEVMKADLSDPVNRSNLEAAKHGADDRGWIGDAHEEYDSERRSDAGDPDKEFAKRQASLSKRLDAVERKANMQKFVVSLALLMLCVGLIILFFEFEPDEVVAEIDCNSPQAEGVNWNNCNFQGIDLSGAVLTNALIRNANFANVSLFQARLQGVDFAYTNLSLANLRMTDMRKSNLVGAVLRNTDMRGANLQGADLSYADLLGAQLAGVNLAGAKLDKAIWIDGQVCQQGSTGVCRFSQ